MDMDCIGNMLSGSPLQPSCIIWRFEASRRRLGSTPRRSTGRVRAEHFLALVLLTVHPALSKFWGPIIGPFVAIISCVCSVGNIPLAAVLWNGGISFGGVVAFILADLIVLPILDIYRRYYGMKMSLFILVTFYFSMSLAALAIDFAFQSLG
jgi:uncharacterized protein